MKIAPRLLLIVMLALALIAIPSFAYAAPNQDDFFDDFSDENMDGWGAWGPATWTVENGELVGSVSEADSLSGVWIGSADWSDYVFEVDVIRDIGGVIGIAFRSSDVQGYWLVLGADPDEVILGTFREQEGSYGLVSADYAQSNGEWYHIRIVIVGASILAYINDSLIVQYTDVDPVPSGNISLQVNTLDSSPEERIRYDNVGVTFLDEKVYLPLVMNSSTVH